MFRPDLSGQPPRLETWNSGHKSASERPGRRREVYPARQKKLAWQTWHYITRAHVLNRTAASWIESPAASTPFYCCLVRCQQMCIVDGTVMVDLDGTTLHEPMS